MGNPAELEKILIQQLDQMNSAEKDQIILSTDSDNNKSPPEAPKKPQPKQTKAPPLQSFF